MPLFATLPNKSELAQDAVLRLNDMLKKPLHECDEFSLSAMHQAQKKLGNYEKCRQIEQHVKDTPHMEVKMRKLKGYIPIVN